MTNTEHFPLIKSCIGTVPIYYSKNGKNIFFKILIDEMIIHSFSVIMFAHLKFMCKKMNWHNNEEFVEGELSLQNHII